MTRSVLSVCALALLPTLLLAQKGGEEQAISYTVPFSIEYERFLSDSIWNSDVRDRAFRPLDPEVEVLTGQHGIGVQFFVPPQLREGVDFEKILEQISSFFDFREQLKTDFALSFCLEEVMPLSIDEEILERAPLDSTIQQQRAWFSSFAQAVKRVETNSEGVVLPVFVLDMDAIGFASSAGHANATDLVVLSSKLLLGELEGRLPEVTLAHLIANYLGVKPLWYNEQGWGDLVEDTPCHDAPNFGNTLSEQHLSLCTPMQLELSHNLMDNLNDAYRMGLTEGQLQRIMHTLLHDPFRSSLLEGSCKPDEMNKEAAFHLPIEREVNGLAVTPNPADLNVQLTVENRDVWQAATYAIVSSSGAVLKTGSINSQQTELDVNELMPGQYYVLVQSPKSELLRSTLTIVR